MINTFANNISTDIKHSKDQIIQSGRSFVSWIGKLRKNALTNVDILFAGENVPRLVRNIASMQ